MKIKPSLLTCSVSPDDPVDEELQREADLMNVSIDVPTSHPSAAVSASPSASLSSAALSSSSGLGTDLDTTVDLSAGSSQLNASFLDLLDSSSSSEPLNP